jgi:uncharacterized protein (DUF2062 family)
VLKFLEALLKLPMAQRITFKEKIKEFVQQGATPKALAASATIGLLLGIFPVLGVTTLMMGAISVRWRLNLPLMLGISYVIYPFQIGLLIPFVRVGEWATGAAPAQLSFDAMGKAFEANFFGTLVDLVGANLQALVGWSLLAAPIGLILYYSLLCLFQFFLPRFKSPAQPLS